MWGGLDPPAELVAALAGSQANPAPATWAGSCCFSGLSRIDKRSRIVRPSLNGRRLGRVLGGTLIAGGLVLAAAGIAGAAVTATPEGPDSVVISSDFNLYPQAPIPAGCNQGEAFLAGARYSVVRGTAAAGRRRIADHEREHSQRGNGRTSVSRRHDHDGVGRVRSTGLRRRGDRRLARIEELQLAGVRSRG